MKEKINKLKQNSGCLGWLFGLIGLSRFINKFNINQRVIATPPKDLSTTETKIVHQAITGENLRYVRPEQIPSQPEYVPQRGGKILGAYHGRDPRGGSF